MPPKLATLVRQLQVIATRAGEAHHANLEVAVTNAIRLTRYPPHVQGMLISMQVMQFTVMDECLPKGEVPSG